MADANRNFVFKDKDSQILFLYQRFGIDFTTEFSISTYKIETQIHYTTVSRPFEYQLPLQYDAPLLKASNSIEISKESKNYLGNSIYNKLSRKSDQNLQALNLLRDIFTSKEQNILELGSILEKVKSILQIARAEKKEENTNDLVEEFLDLLYEIKLKKDLFDKGKSQESKNSDSKTPQKEVPEENSSSMIKTDPEKPDFDKELRNLDLTDTLQRALSSVKPIIEDANLQDFAINRNLSKLQKSNLEFYVWVANTCEQIIKKVKDEADLAAAQSKQSTKKPGEPESIPKTGSTADTVSARPSNPPSFGYDPNSLRSDFAFISSAKSFESFIRRAPTKNGESLRESVLTDAFKEYISKSEFAYNLNEIKLPKNRYYDDYLTKVKRTSFNYIQTILTQQKGNSKEQKASESSQTSSVSALSYNGSIQSLSKGSTSSTKHSNESHPSQPAQTAVAGQSNPKPTTDIQIDIPIKRSQTIRPSLFVPELPASPPTYVSSESTNLSLEKSTAESIKPIPALETKTQKFVWPEPFIAACKDTSVSSNYFFFNPEVSELTVGLPNLRGVYRLKFTVDI